MDIYDAARCLHHECLRVRVVLRQVVCLKVQQSVCGVNLSKRWTVLLHLNHLSAIVTNVPWYQHVWSWTAWLYLVMKSQDPSASSDHSGHRPTVVCWALVGILRMNYCALYGAYKMSALLSAMPSETIEHLRTQTRKELLKRSNKIQFKSLCLFFYSLHDQRMRLLCFEGSIVDRVVSQEYLPNQYNLHVVKLSGKSNWLRSNVWISRLEKVKTS